LRAEAEVIRNERDDMREMLVIYTSQEAFANRVATAGAFLKAEHEAAQPEVVAAALALAEAYHELRRTLLTPYRSAEDVREYESWYRHGAGLAKAVDLALEAYQAARGAK